MYAKYSSPNSLLLIKGYKTSALIPDPILTKYKKQASETQIVIERIFAGTSCLAHVF
jgi:hypothetical protein